jgi:hypothetical protein
VLRAPAAHGVSSYFTFEVRRVELFFEVHKASARRIIGEIVAMNQLVTLYNDGICWSYYIFEKIQQTFETANNASKSGRT